MRLLVLGGTLFLGRHVVDAALARGHRVTLFHRGRTNPGLFPDVPRVLGDRDGGLAPLAGRAFDAVVDTSGYLPRVVAASAGLLATTCGHYVFVSTASVYASPLPPGADESQPVGALDDPATETIDGATYGPLKALCEHAVREAFPGRATIARAGLIVGPHDPTDRFTYWPRRLVAGGDVVCPPDPRQPVQWIDARDLAAWIVTCAESRIAGTYNVAGPETATDLGRLFEDAATALGTSPRLRWTPPDVLARHDVAPWTGLPLWVPPEAAGMLAIDARAAFAAGLACRPVAETVRDTAAWAATLDRPPRAGPPRGAEDAILRALGVARAEPA